MSFYIFSLVYSLISNPQTVSTNFIPPNWIPVYKSSTLLGKKMEKKGVNNLKLLEKDNEKLEKAKNTLLFYHYICKGDFKSAELNFTKIKEKKITLILAYNSVDEKNNLTFKQTPFFKHMGSILKLYSSKNCSIKGKLWFGNKLYPLLTVENEKKLMDLWLLRVLKAGVSTLEFNDYTGLIKFRVLAFKKLFAFTGTGKWEATDEKVFSELKLKLKIDTPFPGVYPWRLSLLIPLSGKYRILGKQILYGILAAKKELPGLEIIVHNTMSSPTKTLNIIKTKIPADKSVGIIAPPDKKSLSVLLSQKLNIPVFYTGDSFGLKKESLKNIFFSIPPRKSKVESLIDHAVKDGAKTFALIHPRTKYGEQYKEIFKKLILAKKLKLVKTVSYDRKRMPKKIKLSKIQAVFIPDVAKRVESLARIIAAGGTFFKPLKNGKGMILLTTAEGLDQKLFLNNKRYVNGAYFTPGFYPYVKSFETDTLVKTLTKWKLRPILVSSGESYLLYKLIHSIIGLGICSSSELQKILSTLKLGPGMGLMFNKFGENNRTPRIYKFYKSKLNKIK
jgi:ABC-type branched-subunit amino acid transport system substrate-binding protein